MNFEKIAPYLADPFVLAGFVLFLIFSIIRVLIKKGIIPTLKQSSGYSIVKIFLHWGFIVGIVVVVLAFLYKSKQLDQQAKIQLEKSEAIESVATNGNQDLSKLIKIKAKNFDLQYPAVNPTTEEISSIKVHISYPQIFNYPDEKIERKINLLLEDEAGVNADHKSEYLDHTSDFKVISLEYDTLTILFEDGGVYLGAGSGVTVDKTLSINLKNGEPYQLKDIFRAGFEASLVDFAKKIAKCEVTGATPDLAEVKDDQAFYVSDGNLVLVYQRRDVCPGADGPVFVPIPLGRLKSITNPNGPLSYIL